ncbi:MAG: lipoyl synthase [Bacteroidia bacterium]|nr:lipoyl synthase [Bacteroidia bacterium]
METIEIQQADGTKERVRRPDWLKVKVPLGTKFSEIRHLVDAQRLNTVCEDARCPNMAECWNRGTATFMILGDVCTRSCGFCSVKTGRPYDLDLDEPRRVAVAVAEMKLRHAVITSVNRDELPDGGAGIFAATIRAIRNRVPGCNIEVLTPDFQGKAAAIQTVIDARPDVFNHNTETVPRLYRRVRPQAKYQRSLELLRMCKEQGLRTKTGIMLGLGETDDEILQVMKDLRTVRVDIMTLGQYLQPTKEHLPVERYVTPAEFARWKSTGLELGFAHVESGPLVRSSYHADEQTNDDCLPAEASQDNGTIVGT